MKMFVNFKNSSMFAVSFAKRYIKNTLIVGAFFYANTVSANAESIQGYQTPFTDCYTIKYCNCLLAKTEGDSLSYIQLTNNFIRKMPKDNGITERVNNSNSIRTPRSARTAPIGFKTNLQVSEFSTSSVEHIQENNNHHNYYLQAVLKAFTDFIRDESKTKLDSNHYNIAQLKSKLEAAQLLFPEDRKNFEYTLNF